MALCVSNEKMNNHKLYKAWFVAGSLIFVAAASGMIAVAKRVVPVSAVSHKNILHQFDSNGLCTCIPTTGNSGLENAPRLELNESISPYVQKYNNRNGFFLDKAKEKTKTHFATLDSVLRHCGVPAELKYLAFIESGMKKNPVTRTGAIGPWALMPKAARDYGLKTGRNDERLNYIKSTVAAAALLKDSYQEYGDWLLAVASYNCGPAWMKKAIKRAGSSDYWLMQKYLPEETRSHVKKFIAVHYHFEGHGSIVTMTKAELSRHIEDVTAYTEKLQQQPVDSSAITKLK